MHRFRDPRLAFVACCAALLVTACTSDPGATTDDTDAHPTSAGPSGASGSPDASSSQDASSSRGASASEITFRRVLALGTAEDKKAPAGISGRLQRLYAKTSCPADGSTKPGRPAVACGDKRKFILASAVTSGGVRSATAREIGDAWSVVLLVDSATQNKAAALDDELQEGDTRLIAVESSGRVLGTGNLEQVAASSRLTLRLELSEDEATELAEQIAGD